MKKNQETAQSEYPTSELDSPTKKSPDRSTLVTVLIPLALLVGILVGAFGGYLFWGQDAALAQEANATAQAVQQAMADVQAAEQSAAAAPSQPQQVQRYDVPEDDDPSIGPDDAPITIIEFSDYQCPYCQRWHEQVFLRLRAEYPDTVRFVYRDFPLTSIHPEAVPAAEAANCADEQDAFWDYHNALFSNQYELSSQAYTNYASDLGLDVESFEACLTSGKYNDEVMADFSYAANLGVQSTPTFFINGIPIVGAQPYEVFQQVIEKELAGEIP